MRVLLAGDLLLGGQDRLDGAEVDVHHARVRALLHDAGDDVALFAAELAQHGIVGDVAQPLADDLLRGEGGDAAEVVGRGLLFADDRALVVDERQEDRDVTGLAVQDRACSVGQFARGGGVLRVGGQDRLLDDAHELIEGDLLLSLNRPQE